MTLNSPVTVIYYLHFSNRPVTIAFPTFSALHHQQKACSISRMASDVGVALTATKILHILLYTNGGCQVQPSYDPVDMAAAIKST